MADEITIDVRLKAEKDSSLIDEEVRRTGLTFTMSGTAYDRKVQTISFAAAENLSISGDIATLGYCYLRNVDPTNTIKIGIDSGGGAFVPMMRLKAGGEPALFRWEPGVTPMAQAMVADAKLELFVLED